MQWLKKRLIRNKIISGTAVLKGISLSGTDLTSPKKWEVVFDEVELEIKVEGLRYIWYKVDAMSKRLNAKVNKLQREQQQTQ